MVASAISSPDEMDVVLQEIAEELMNEVSEVILDIFLNEYVVKYAYASGRTRYTNPSGKFIEAWEWTELKKSSKELSMTMFNNWQNMTPGTESPRDNFIHSSRHNPDKWGYDTRDKLAAYLDDGIPNAIDSSRLGGYWKKFSSEMIDSGKLEQLIGRYAKKYGLSISVSAG